MTLFSRTIFRTCPAFNSRGFHASYSLHNEFKKVMFRLNGFNKFGLLADDLVNQCDPDNIEAIRRLPEEEQMQRKYRAIRASQAELNNSLLPKEQWTKFEDNHDYLQPYIQEVKKEREEREEWEATH